MRDDFLKRAAMKRELRAVLQRPTQARGHETERGRRRHNKDFTRRDMMGQCRAYAVEKRIARCDDECVFTPPCKNLFDAVFKRMRPRFHFTFDRAYER